MFASSSINGHFPLCLLVRSQSFLPWAIESIECSNSRLAYASTRRYKTTNQTLQHSFPRWLHVLEHLSYKSFTLQPPKSKITPYTSVQNKQNHHYKQKATKTSRQKHKRHKHQHTNTATENTTKEGRQINVAIVVLLSVQVWESGKYRG